MRANRGRGPLSHVPLHPVRRVGNGEALPTRLPGMNADYPWLCLSRLLRIDVPPVGAGHAREYSSAQSFAGTARSYGRSEHLDTSSTRNWDRAQDKAYAAIYPGPTRTGFRSQFSSSLLRLIGVIKSSRCLKAKACCPPSRSVAHLVLVSESQNIRCIIGQLGGDTEPHNRNPRRQSPTHAARVTRGMGGQYQGSLPIAVVARWPAPLAWRLPAPSRPETDGSAPNLPQRLR